MIDPRFECSTPFVRFYPCLYTFSLVLGTQKAHLWVPFLRGGESQIRTLHCNAMPGFAFAARRSASSLARRRERVYSQNAKFSSKGAPQVRSLCYWRICARTRSRHAQSKEISYGKRVSYTSSLSSISLLSYSNRSSMRQPRTFAKARSVAPAALFMSLARISYCCRVRRLTPTFSASSLCE